MDLQVLTRLPVTNQPIIVRVKPDRPGVVGSGTHYVQVLTAHLPVISVDLQVIFPLSLINQSMFMWNRADQVMLGHVLTCVRVPGLVLPVYFTCLFVMNVLPLLNKRSIFIYIVLIGLEFILVSFIIGLISSVYLTCLFHVQFLPLITKQSAHLSLTHLPRLTASTPPHERARGCRELTSTPAAAPSGSSMLR